MERNELKYQLEVALIHLGEACENFEQALKIAGEHATKLAEANKHLSTVYLDVNRIVDSLPGEGID